MQNCLCSLFIKGSNQGMTIFSLHSLQCGLISLSKVLHYTREKPVMQDLVEIFMRSAKLNHRYTWNHKCLHIQATVSFTLKTS